MQKSQQNDQLLVVWLDDAAVADNHQLKKLISAASSSGVTAVHIIAIEASATESAHNVNSVLKLLRLERLTDVFPEPRLAMCVDLKLAQYLLAKKRSSSRYACLFCLFSDNPKHSHADTNSSVASNCWVSAGAQLTEADLSTLVITTIFSF